MASLLVRIPGKNPYRLTLASGVVSIGRSSSNRIVIAQDPKVSRTHCELKPSAGHWIVMDLNTSNGTRVEGKKIPAGVVELFHGDNIGVGGAEIVFEDPEHRRGSIATRIMGGISRLLKGGSDSKGPDEKALLAKGRMRCPGCGAIINISGKPPGERVGCPRCRNVHNVPRA